jgi:hypothetical protein
MKNQEDTMTVAGDFGDYESGNFLVTVAEGYRVMPQRYIRRFPSKYGKIRPLTEAEKSEIVMEVVALACTGARWAFPDGSPHRPNINFYFPGEEAPVRPTTEEVRKALSQ